ncbi:chaperone protein ClpB4 mitochondrial [Tripterygium wilfordii]|uniref:Chaperone protein ClpB4 mitochondrial n=1 Tax=Tripterygium wilfordii TaxID=458696 RepID=A0A7J7DW98_TRIWF|nr:protein SMAX1-LIKE 3-like isoform X2 [Tripterygium wilfordii]KAF5750573.1 chaperone protein ClpB4 mitochondrial [Tripterygium wilfordii]
MRAGGCTVQQALTAEAASVVKQAVALARRRGHAQVTPLHVANTMLTASTGLLRTACLQSHSHPLQCKALELCFNVALNRLPASTSGPMLGTHHSHHQHFPSISNALVAAFKRAQAHQRRGSIENQQQPLLAVKIVLEQLIISILDDPSVSRVMREAGFNSTQVKSNVEQAMSLEVCNSQSVNCNKEDNSINVLDQGKPKVLDPIRNEDVMSVIDNLMNRRKKSSVIVGECVSTIEGAVKGVMDKFDKGDVPEGLRDVKLLTLSLSSLGHLSIIEEKLKEISSLVIKSSSSRGFVLYLGDLKWVIEQRNSDQVEHMIREIGRLLVCENGRFWILGIATFQTYMRCKTSYPSLETVWGLHPLTIPSNSLCLSLISSTDSDLGSQSKINKAENGHNWFLLEGEELSCCAECSAKFEAEAKSLHSSTNSSSCSTTSALPAWLQQYKNETQRPNSMDQDCVSIKDLCKKWNSICGSKHRHQRRPYSSEKTLAFSSLSPSPSTSGFSFDQNGPNLHQTHYNFSAAEPKMPWRDYNHLWITETVINGPTDPSLRIYMPPSTSNPNSTQNSSSSSDVMEIEYVQKFSEYNSDNLATLCNALESKVPLQRDVIEDIASTVLKCRSGMVKRKDKRETWLLFQGNDVETKEKIAKELGRLIFGGSSRTDNFVSISFSSFSSTRADSTDHHHHHQDCRNNYKRSRDGQSCSYIERFVEAVSSNPHRVFLIEDVETADYWSQMGFKRAIERGRVSNGNGVEVGLSDAIIILSCEGFFSRSRPCSPPLEEAGLGPELEETTTPCLDLNVSVEDDSEEIMNQSIDDIGLLDSVDRPFVFKMPS